MKFLYILHWMFDLCMYIRAVKWLNKLPIEEQEEHCSMRENKPGAATAQSTGQLAYYQRGWCKVQEVRTENWQSQARFFREIGHSETAEIKTRHGKPAALIRWDLDAKKEVPGQIGRVCLGTRISQDNGTATVSWPLWMWRSWEFLCTILRIYFGS